MKKNTFHKNFRLNGMSFTSEEELLHFSKTINKAVFLFLSDWFSANDFVVVQTSGSTGKPKSISLKKELMINSAKATGSFFYLKEDTTALLCLSADYIAGKMMLVRALTLGWHIDVVAPIAKVTIAKQYDFSAMVPMQLRCSLESISKIKKLIVGGGVVANDLLEVIQNSATEVFATYGMTETITHIAVRRLNHDNKKSTYKTLPNVQLSQDDRNCLVIDAPKIASEKIITNDVVCLHSETEFEWLGRYDNVINSGGVKLHPEKIEEKLAKIITSRFFVIGVPDKRLGEKLILIVEGVAFNKVEIEKSLKTKIENLQNLSKYEIPKAIYFVEKFVETETKKIQRKKTLDLIARR